MGIWHGEVSSGTSRKEGQLDLELPVRTRREMGFRMEKGSRLHERRVEELVPRWQCGEPGGSCKAVSLLWEG